MRCMVLLGESVSGWAAEIKVMLMMFDIDAVVWRS